MSAIKLLLQKKRLLGSLLNQKYKWFFTGAGKTFISPVDFPTLPFSFYRDGANVIQTDFSINDYTTVGDYDYVYYINKSSGVDDKLVNNGTTELTPWKTFNYLFIQIGGYTNKKVLIVVTSSGVWYKDEFCGGSLGSTVNVKTGNHITITTKNEADRIIVSNGITGLSWALDGEYTNTYKATHTSALFAFIDLTEQNKDPNGLPQPYLLKTSAAQVEATAGSYYITGNDIYVHTLTHEIPNNSTTFANIAGYNLRFAFYTGSRLMLNNVDDFGGNIYISSSDNLAATIITNNCKSSLSSANGFATNNIMAVNHFNLIVGYAKRDCINYAFASIPEISRRSCLAIEYNCRGYNAGHNDSNTNNNGSTCHDGANVIRFSTLAENTKGPVITDVNGCYSILFDCNAFNSISGDAVYYFDNVSNPAGITAKLIMVNCLHDGETMDSPDLYITPDLDATLYSTPLTNLDAGSGTPTYED